MFRAALNSVVIKHSNTGNDKMPQWDTHEQSVIFTPFGNSYLLVNEYLSGPLLYSIYLLNNYRWHWVQHISFIISSAYCQVHTSLEETCWQINIQSPLWILRKTSMIMKGKLCLDSEYFLNAKTFCLTLYKKCTKRNRYNRQPDSTKR